MTATAASTPGPEGKTRSGNGNGTRTRARNGNSSTAYHNLHGANAPLSARRSQPLDLTSVERRGQATPVRDSPKRIRPYNLPEAPTFRPTEAEFRDPVEYIQKIAPIGREYGLVKIIPPDSWQPAFAIDTEVR